MNLGPGELLLFGAAFGTATAIVFSRKGRNGFVGFFLGFAFGPIGLAIALMLDPVPGGWPTSPPPPEV